MNDLLNKDEVKLLDIVAFCILMQDEGRGGVLGKSPDYILEKYNRYCKSKKTNNWMWGLDLHNHLQLKLWSNKWLKKDLPKGGNYDI